MRSSCGKSRRKAVFVACLLAVSTFLTILMAAPQLAVAGGQSYGAPLYLNNLSQGASGGSKQLDSFVGSSNPVGSVRVGTTIGDYPMTPAAASSVATGTPSESAPNGRGYMTVGQSPVGSIAAGTWLFNMTLQDTRAAGVASIWITVFSCNQQDIARASPAAPTCTFLFKTWNNSTNVKATMAPTPYTYSKTVGQFTGVQVLYIEYWIHYTVDGGDNLDTITINTGYGVSIPGAGDDGASVKTPSATYWLNFPDAACTSGCATLSTTSGSADTSTKVTIGTTTGKYLVRPTATSTTTGTPHSAPSGGTVVCGGSTCTAGWLVLNNAFLGSNIAAGTWTFNVETQDALTNPMVVDGHGISAATGLSPTVSVTTARTNDIIVVFLHCDSGGTFTSISDTAGLTWNTRVAFGAVGGRSQAEFWALSAGSLSGDTVTAVTSGTSSCRLMYIAINGANTASPYDPNVQEPATVNGNSPTTCTMTTTGQYDVLIGEVGQGGSPSWTQPAGWTKGDSGLGFSSFDAWSVVSAAVTGQSETWRAAAGSNISGLCDAISSDQTLGTANLWISVFSCNVPNLGQGQIIINSAGQSGQVCRMVVKNWDNSTNLLATTSAQTLTFTSSGSAFNNVQYLDVEMWISYTAPASGSSQVTFTVQDASTSVATPSGTTYYATAQGSSCLFVCQSLFYYDGSQLVTTSVNVATNVGKYQVRPTVAGSTARGTSSVSSPDGYAWTTEGAINGTIRSGSWKFVMSLTDSVPGETAFLWFSIWNCARPNIGQAGAGCTFMFKNWDNSSNISGNGFGTFTYTTANQPAFTGVKYLAIEVWISETATSGSSPDTITFHFGDTESFVGLPRSQNNFYYTGKAMTCAIGCNFFSSSTGSANTATKVTIGTTTNKYEVRPYVTSGVAVAPSQQTTIGSGWETSTPMNRNISSGTWRFNMTIADAVSQLGTAALWLKVYSCATSIAGSPSNTGNCVFLFKNYDNTTNIKLSSSATKYSYVTASEPLFHNVQYLYIEFWIDYMANSGAAGDQLTITTVSAASSVETPLTTAAGLSGLQIDGGKIVDTATGTQQLRISTSTKNSMLYLTVSLAVNSIGFVVVSDDANLTWNFRSEKVGSADILMIFYAIAKPLLQGDVVTVGSGIAAQTPMSITVFTGENTASPFDSLGSSVGTTKSTTIATPVCGASSCTLTYGSDVAQKNLLVAALAYSVASSTCNAFASATDTLGSTLAIEVTSSVTLASNCYESVIVGGYAGGSGADTITINFPGGIVPGNQRGQLFELVGMSTTLDGTFTGSGVGTAVSTSGSATYDTNDFLVATFAGSAATTSLTPGAGFTICTNNFRSDCEYQTALVPGTTDFPFTVAPRMTWSEAAVSFESATSNQTAFAVATNAVPTINIYTTNSNNIILGVVDARTVTAPTAGAGYTLLATPVVAPSTNTMATEYQAFMTVQSDLVVSFGLGSSVAWIIGADAIAGAFFRGPADGFVVSDSPSTSLSFARSPADSFASSDTLSAKVNLARSAADASTFSDAATRSLALPRTPSDSFSFSESLARSLSLSRGPSDSFAVVESVVGNILASRATADSFSIADSPGRQVSDPRATADSALVADSAVRAILLPRVPSDSFVFVEAVAGMTAFGRAIQDAFSFVDSTVSNSVLARGPSDTFVFSDSVGRLQVLLRSPSDSFSFSDVASRLLSLGRSVGDSFAFVDSTVSSSLNSRGLSDSFGFSDAVNRFLLFPRGLADSFSFTDIVSSLVSLTQSVGDSFSFSDLPGRMVALDRAVGESLIFSDLASGAAALGRAVADAFSMSDSAARALTLNAIASDLYGFGDDVAGTLATVRDAFDGFGFTDVANHVANFNIAVQDLFTVSDSVVRQLKRMVQAFDIFTFRDRIGTLRHIPGRTFVDVTDGFQFLERAVVTARFLRGILDTSYWTDGVARSLDLLRSMSSLFPFRDVANRSASLIVAVEDAIRALENAFSSAIQSTTSTQGTSTGGGNPRVADIIFFILPLFLLLLALLVLLAYVRRKRRERDESPMASASPSYS